MWEERYQELKVFRREHGHTRVKGTDPDPKHKALATWVSKHRGQNKKGQLATYRKQKLDAIGFIWKVNNIKDKEDRDTTHLEIQFQKQYESLVEYKKEHGDCMVPPSYETHPGLGRWVNKRRMAFKKGEMPDYHQDLLNKLGFVWRVDVTTPRKVLTSANGKDTLPCYSNLKRNMATVEFPTATTRIHPLLRG
jgi:hypothetical protein